MAYVWATSLVVVNLVWLALVVFGLPGTWLMVLSTALVAWRHWDASGEGDARMFGIPVLIAIVALAFTGELLELFAGAVGSKHAGGTRRGAIGALVGGIIGALVGTVFIPIPFLGSLLGACAGAGIGAWSLELSGGLAMRASLRSGVGAGVGKLAGIVSKLGTGVLIWLVVAVAAFWP